MSEPDEPLEPPRTRLDPDRAIAEAQGLDPDTEGVVPRPAPRLPPPVIDTRRYQWMIGGFGVLLLAIFSIYLYANNGSTEPGIAPGRLLHRFVAPLATSNLNLPANANPHCNPARPARRGLNVCGREPIVLAFFALGAQPCEREVDALQAVSARFPKIQFAAVAVNADRGDTARVVRRHGWTIPVAFDSSGVIGQVYGVNVCPLVEFAGSDGRIDGRLIGEGWERPARLAARIAQFASEAGVA